MAALSTYIPPITVTTAKETSTVDITLAVKDINKSIGWSRYNSLIFTYLFKDSESFFVARNKEGAISGYAIIRDDHIDAEAKYLSFIAVKPDFQGKGAGLSLMQQVIIKTAELGRKKLTFDFRGNNEKTRSFYESLPLRLGETFTIARSEFSADGVYLNGDPRVCCTYFLS